MRTHDAGAVAFSHGPKGVYDAAAVTFARDDPTVRVAVYSGMTVGTAEFIARANTLAQSASTLGYHVETLMWEDQWYNSTQWLTPLHDVDVLVVAGALGSSDATALRAACDEAECHFIVHPQYFGEIGVDSTYGDGGVVEDFGLCSTAGSGRYSDTNIIADGCDYAFLSTHPSHSFAAGDYNLYNDEAPAGLSTGTTFVGTGIGWHTSTQEEQLSSTEAAYCYVVLQEGTTDYSTGGVVRRRSMIWGGGIKFVSDESTGSVRLVGETLYWMLSTAPLIPYLGGIWGQNSVTLDAGPYRHVDPSKSHAATRWQIDYSTGDWSSPIVETGWSTHLYQYTSTAILPGVAYKARVAFLDSSDGESRWSAGQGAVSATVEAEAGIKVEMISSTGGVLGSYYYWTNSYAYVERVVEALQPPADTVAVRLTPVKQGTADRGVCAKEVYVESGSIAAGYHPAPLYPARDTDARLPPSWADLGTSTSTGVAVDFSTARHQAITMAHNVTFSFSGYQAGGRYLLLCEQDGTGSRLGVFSGVEWPGGTAPTLTTTTGAKDIIVLDAESTAILHGSFRLDSK